MPGCSQSSFQKLNVDNSCQKTRKTRYYIFEVLSNFIVSLYFVPNILSRIAVKLKKERQGNFDGELEAKLVKNIVCRVPPAPVPEQLSRLP